MASIARAKTTRADRAAAEGPGYRWTRTGGNWFCQSLRGGTYEVDQHRETCSCPDFLARCQDLGCPCKHLLALNAGLGEFPLDPFGEPGPRTADPEWDAILAARAAERERPDAEFYALWH